MLVGYRTLGSLCLKQPTGSIARLLSTKEEARRRRNEIFDKETKRIRSATGRIEKIQVKYISPQEEILLVMNKNLSTPHHCAKHISEGVTTSSALASVDGAPWDMHKPLTSDCELKLFSMRTPTIPAVNTSFWRSCSFLLGAVIDKAFKSDVKVHLHSFPWPNIRSGSFIYDAELGLANWTPTDSEKRALSALFVKLINSSLPFERLETTEDVVLAMFEDNPHKSNQIPNIAKRNNGRLLLYRVGDHIDISKGPMIANTDQIGRCTISAIHQVQTEDKKLYRFQGVALPSGIIINYFAYNILENRAKKLNNAVWIPQKVQEESSDEENVVAAAN